MPPAGEPGSAPDDSGVATAASRGVIYIAAAKLYFMVAGAVIEFRLPAIFSKVTFGAYGIVVAVVSPINSVLITGTIQSVSRFVAQSEDKAKAIQRAGLMMHLCIGIPVSLAFIAGSPLIAWLLGDQGKTHLFMLAGLVVLAYSFYAVFVGTLNGRKEFHKQAGLDMTSATLRAGGILGMASAGLGVAGAVSGWVGAAGAMLVIACFVVGVPLGRNRSAETFPLRPLVSFFAQVAFYLILLNLILVADTILLKRLSFDWFSTFEGSAADLYKGRLPSWLLAPVGALDPAQAADGQVGYYRAVQNLARLSYQAIIAATFVIFPLVSKTTFEADRKSTVAYVRTTCRYSLIFAAAIGVVLAANPLEILDIPYDRSYATTGAPALVALAIGSVAFALFAIAGTILNGAGFTGSAIAVAAFTLVASVVANAIVIPLTEPGSSMLLGCAVATGAAMILGAGLGGLILKRRLGAFVPLVTILRVLVSGGAAIGIGRLLVFQGALMTLVEAAIVGGAFFAVLAITGELRLSDLVTAARVLRGKKKEST